MPNSIQFKRGDTAAVIRATLYSDDASTTPLDLTGASVKFIMALIAAEPGTPVVNGACTIIDAVNGRVGYDWMSTDVAVAGVYMAEFQVTYSDGKIQTFPRVEYLAITITEDLD